MKNAEVSLARGYAAALARYLDAADEGALRQAEALGDAAFRDGVDVLDLVSTHHAALVGAVGHGGGLPEVATRRAAGLLSACLAPYQRALATQRAVGGRPSRADGSAPLWVRLETALRHAHELDAAGRLASGIAHHFNNLFTIVLGNLDRARRRCAGDPELAGLIATASRATERGARMVKDLQAFAGHLPLASVRIAPAAALRDMIAAIARGMPDGVVVAGDIADDLWRLEVDPARLADALMRLCRNAADALSSGGTIQIAAANRVVRDPALGLHGAHVAIEVVDHGHGIMPEVLDRVFDPFVTTRDVGAADGLGLSVVHGFARQSGGAVEIASAPGQGTRVTLYLPAVQDPAAGP